MTNSNLFKTEIDLIQSEDYRGFVKFYLDEKTPAYFFTCGASSSGKYHPAFSQGEGGLVRHSKAVARIAEELMRMNSYGYMNDDYKDFVRIACIVHDTAKYGLRVEMNKEDYEKHAENAGENVYCAWVEYFGVAPNPLLIMAIKAHMGQWEPNRENRPFTQIDRCVHLADYIASRPFIDIPSVVEDYNETLATDGYFFNPFDNPCPDPFE